ncbi:MAG: ImmA/IrrE family metallo-endopeptidase [Actinophytocola sp.]|uniref:helix-turn-helix domain-containing protein n=1 Tax=Actinophytocola sp. TaxID=1872138 RepID=UPI00132C8034|nr:XRE family transcriptional regulator [Actinophytocola sp.]MPZ83329.1 ImmA/IrrE family metallo-endopeptidase [Actinophytocola sp.]
MSSVPDRVLSLIEVSGLSRHAFALRIGLDDSKLSKSLSGARRFSSLDLARMADLCQVTVDWLITGEEPPLAVAARTTGGDAGAALVAAKRYSTLRADMASLGYPQPWRPMTTGLGTGGYVEQGHRLAEDALARVRRAGRSISEGALAALIEEVFGADVAVVELGTGFDGLAVASDDVKLILLATSHVPARQRFTLAHELGHLLAGDGQDVHLDRDIFDKSQAKDPSELRANAFASVFLMPEGILRDAVGSTGLTDETFAVLSCELMVTPSALAYRLLRLRLIDAGSCDRYKAITAARAASTIGLGEQFAQRVTEAGTPRPPGLLVRDTYAAYESGAATLRPYANLLETDVDDLRRALESEHGTHDAS